MAYSITATIEGVAPILIIRRPALSVGWRLPFTLNIVEDRRSPDSIRVAIETAGTKVGLGSWRPEFGRFVLREWSVS